MNRCVPSLEPPLPPPPPPLSWEGNILALIKGPEQYVFLYDDQYRTDLLRTLGIYASNPDLSFTWYDAAMLSQKVRAVRAAKSICRSAD